MAAGWLDCLLTSLSVYPINVPAILFFISFCVFFSFLSPFFGYCLLSFPFILLLLLLLFFVSRLYTKSLFSFVMCFSFFSRACVCCLLWIPVVRVFSLFLTTYLVCFVHTHTHTQSMPLSYSRSYILLLPSCKHYLTFCLILSFYMFLSIDVPRVRLELGRNLESEHIREGIDVYFDCHVTARPSAVRLVWRHQVCPIYLSIYRLYI